MPKKISARTGRPIRQAEAESLRCGLCGKTQNLTRTECCGQRICDDGHTYVLFSYARNSCHRNHSRYTLCAYHHIEKHAGDWQSCPQCRASFGTEIYVWFGTNEYNFETLDNPPAYEPTCCGACGRVIRLGEEGYTLTPDQTYFCMECANRAARLKAKAPRPQTRHKKR